MTDIDAKAEGIKRRAETLALTASSNAALAGGDNACAAMDLMLAFVLLSTRSGGNPEFSIKSASEDAIFAASEFWGKNGRRADS